MEPWDEGCGSGVLVYLVEVEEVEIKWQVFCMILSKGPFSVHERKKEVGMVKRNLGTEVGCCMRN